MRYVQAFFFRKLEGTADELGNPAETYELIGSYQSRLTEWTSVEQAAEGRPYTEAIRKLVTRAPGVACDEAYRVTIESDTYTVEKRIGRANDRWRILHLKAVGI